ncbi:PREDICTED: uncharacterized protein LOC107067667 [Polistes dominula]|uniref:Uncharacterized protein LOC107067667 n=1 Tax=Polistes dominula TaxID=743375 RepID=A0ABM1IF65_POLDO|nr:PREDICTED: uncharacterized protein LOC107067667 [Polistes dominula]
MNCSDSKFQDVCTSASNITNNLSAEDAADEDNEKEKENYLELSDMNEISCESDEEDNSYYTTTVWDVPDVEICSPSLINSSPPYNGEIPGMIADTLEILEENNNDPNNNLDFNENHPESSSNRNVDEVTDDHQIGYSRALTSPIPGCSKDIGNMDNFRDNNAYSKIRKDAELISTLLPDIEFRLILQTLKKNQYAKNCNELTLWDLLPDNRPMPQVLSKRKLTDNFCQIESKRYLSNEFNVIPSEVQTNVKITESLKDKKNINIEESINCKIEDEKTVIGGESKSVTSISNNNPIIRPAKLIVPKCVPSYVPSQSVCTPSPNSVILAPAKLTYISTYEINDVKKNKSLSSEKNLTSTQSNSKINNNISETTVFLNIEETKSCLLSENEKHLNSFKNMDIVKMDTSEQSTEFVPSNIDLNLPSTSKGIKKAFKIDVSTMNTFPQQSLNMLKTENTEVSKSDEFSSITEILNINVKEEESKLSPDMIKIYYKLVDIFSSVDPNYIESICKSNDIQRTSMDESTVLNELINHLLVLGDKHPYIAIKSESPEPTYDVNEQYENILGIFPNADPNYIRDVVESLYNKPEELKVFVQSKLETHDYPTREEYLTRRKITEQQKQYTTDFKIEKFLEIFPNPFAHFEDPNRKYSYNTIAFKFLTHYYNQIKANTITLVYRRRNYHLSLTAKALDEMEPNMKLKRKGIYLSPQDIPLLQEITFIQHRSEIQQYLLKLQKEETEEFLRLKKNKSLLECQCCFNDECMPSKCSSCDNGHIFCNDCIIKGTNLKLAESETHIYCFVNCTSEFSLSILQNVLPPTTFSILLQKRQEAEIKAAGLEGLVSCPFCHFASIPPPEDKVFKCLNPDCMKESCRLCKKLNHIPLNCDEVMSENAQHYLEEKMTEALIHKCYKCNLPFFKEEGCNKMVCVCGAEMCYICDKPVKGYKHFRGQGSTDTDLCPLWSDNHVINAKAVLQIAEETEKEIKQRNPNIQLATNALLPKLPRKTKGPHDDIPNSDVVPERAHRIAIGRMIP